ncbi:hypothetical protein HMPREF9244_00817 [Alloscardovia omnicolens F0580]|uniref:Uncharacterized protein n=1 Tax=Alloscardovia omnicolens F0580 TaxID=1321816 RepID=U1RBC6_9BIFI|nr:hypothetical protein HMPREF9244_00817 [Alloscardovia omnicolens F0580]
MCDTRERWSIFQNHKSLLSFISVVKRLTKKYKIQNTRNKKRQK